MNNIIHNIKYLIIIIGSIIILLSYLMHYSIMYDEKVIEEDIFLNITASNNISSKKNIC